MGVVSESLKEKIRIEKELDENPEKFLTKDEIQLLKIKEERDFLKEAILLEKTSLKQKEKWVNILNKLNDFSNFRPYMAIALDCKEKNWDYVIKILELLYFWETTGRDHLLPYSIYFGIEKLKDKRKSQILLDSKENDLHMGLICDMTKIKKEIVRRIILRLNKKGYLKIREEFTLGKKVTRVKLTDDTIYFITLLSDSFPNGNDHIDYLIKRLERKTKNESEEFKGRTKTKDKFNRIKTRFVTKT
jgi:hypothetical protein